PFSAMAGAAGRLFHPATAEARVSMPAMVTRAQWGAMKPRPHCLEQSPEIRMAYVHHTAGTNGYPRWQSPAIVRGIQYYHEVTRGYCDIAYNFLVDRFGTIYVGRAGSDTSNVRPASQMGFNQDTFSVSAMGDYQAVRPPRRIVHAIERILAWRLDQVHLRPTGTALMTSGGGPTDRYPAGRTVLLPLISGHRRTGLTDCPGRFLWRKLPAIRRAAYDIGRPKFFHPRQSRSAITPLMDADRFTARGTDPMLWEVDIRDWNGHVVQTLFATGSSLDASWNGTDRDGLPADPGTYTATVWGRVPSGRRALPATFRTVVNPEPTPTVSPTP
ncbi:MAG TPA: N-acetylmuramoyl-L-alanine amidase, partial [Actinomycetota bacterium]|nr:N-acetylmuramoyl-L-alanine amidase [Actinomycetota bacterium]